MKRRRPEQKLEPTLNTINLNPAQRQGGAYKMKSTDAFPSKFMKSADVKTAPMVAIVSYVTQETVGQDKRTKPVIYLEHGKPIVCNKTNFEAIEAAFGDSDNWPGHKIKIYCAATSFQGKRVDGIRIDPIVPKPAPRGGDLNDEVPAF
jgi:hypothetical protein